MSDLWTVTIYGFIAGTVGTAAGGFLGCFISKTNRRINSFILEYSAGLMIAIVCFDLLPSAFEFSSLPCVLFGLLFGVAIMVLSDIFIDFHQYPKAVSSVRHTGLSIALGIALHNFPEGLAVGSGYEAKASLGISLAIAIMLHDIPEGASIAVPLRAGGSSRQFAFFLTFISGLPMGFGAMAGAWAGRSSKVMIAMCLAIAGGAMLYVIFADMLPESKRMYSGRLGSLGSILGMISGIIISVQLKV